MSRALALCRVPWISVRAGDVLELSVRSLSPRLHFARPGATVGGLEAAAASARLFDDGLVPEDDESGFLARFQEVLACAS